VQDDARAVEVFDGGEQIAGGPAEAVELAYYQIFDFQILIFEQKPSERLALRPFPEGHAAGDVFVGQFGDEVQLAEGAILARAGLLGFGGLFVGRNAAVEEGAIHF